jgi:GxxExxY protein
MRAEPQMNANERRYEGEFLFKDETYQVIGCALEIINTIGSGFFEKIYENALVTEFDLKKIPYSQQSRYPVLYKGKTLGEYVPDLVVFGGIIVEIKTIDKITSQERGQVLNYLKVTGFKVGLVLNFKNSKLEWERIALSKA